MPVKASLMVQASDGGASSSGATPGGSDPTAAAGDDDDDEVPEGPLNLKHGLALAGFDAVSYHDGQPLPGVESLSTEWNGARYLFASEANRQRFLADPEHWAPAYGGWCAWAMRDGKRVGVNPRGYRIVDGRLMLFFQNILADTKERWEKRSAKDGEATLVNDADAAWREMSSSGAHR